MKLRLLSSLVLILAFFNTKAQETLDYQYAYNTIFVDKANIRETPSADGKIVGTKLNGESIRRCYNTNSKLDTVNSEISYWIPIIHNNTIAYIWNEVFCSSLIISQNFSQNKILINHSKRGEIHFKIVKDLNSFYSFLVNYDTSKYINSIYSIGTTYTSNNKELLAIRYNNQTYDLYETDGISINKSKVIFRDESFLTQKYIEFPYSVINEKLVNFRADANIDGKVLKRLALYTYVELIDAEFKKDIIDKKEGFWRKVKYKDQIGYIWNNMLSIPIHYIKTNNNETSSFLYCDKSIFVLEKEKIVAHTNFEYAHYENDFLYHGNKGLKDNYHFVGIREEANSCGEVSGDILYLWDGKKIKYFESSYVVGDGGFSQEHSLIFPSDHGGIKDKVLLYTNGGASINFPQQSDCEEPYSFVLYNEYTATLKYNGDTLIEIESIDLNLKNTIKKQFPKHQLMHYQFVDINKDGINDALFYIINEEYNYSESDEVKTQNKIGIAYGDSKNQFSIRQVNGSLIQSHGNGVILNFLDGNLAITTTYSMGYDSYGDGSSSAYKYDFKYNKEEDKFFWISTTTFSTETDDYPPVWESSTSYFKTKKISFENAWSQSED